MASGSLRQQCQWLGLSRSTYYYQPMPASREDLLLMRILDEQYLETPQYGYRKMGLVLAEAGYVVNHKRTVRRCGAPVDANNGFRSNLSKGKHV